MTKWIITAVVIGAMLVLGFGKDAASYVTTSIGIARETAAEVVPSTFELKRCAQLSGKLGSEIDRLVKRFSAEEIRIEDLEARVKESRDEEILKSLKREIIALRAEIGAKSQVASEQDTPERISVENQRQRLVALFRQYTVREKAMASRNAAISTGRKALARTREKLLTLRAQSELLDAERQRVEARLELAQANDVCMETFDLPSTTKRIEQILKTVDRRIDVAERTEDNRRELAPADRSEPDGISSGNGILETIDEYFKNESKTD